jgi:hypothetical protein
VITGPERQRLGLASQADDAAALSSEALDEIQRRKPASVTRLGLFVGGRRRGCHVLLTDLDNAARHAKLKYCLR